MEKRTINVNTKYSLDDTSPVRREIADLLINGLDLSVFTPEAGALRITGKQILDLALARLVKDVNKAKQEQQSETRVEGAEAAPKPKRKSLEDLANINP